MKNNDLHAALIDKLSNPTPLFEKGSDVPAVWCCGNCRRVYGREKEARHCYSCAPKPCERCGDRVDPRSYCEPCSALRQEEKDQAAFEKAEKIQERDWCGDPVVYDDRYYYEIWDIWDALERDDPDPKWAFATKKCYPTFEPSRILEWVDESANVDEWDGIMWDDEKALYEFVNKWFEKQSTYWFEEDRSRVVILEPREREEDE